VYFIGYYVKNMVLKFIIIYGRNCCQIVEIFPLFSIIFVFKDYPIFYLKRAASGPVLILLINITF